MIVLYILLICRIIHRLYYFIIGHHHPIYRNLKQELEDFLSQFCKVNSIHSFYSSNDNVKLSYRRLGNGKKVIYLLNGVGTGFFMWLPILRFLISYKSNFFEEFTLLVPSYRGLFDIDDMNTVNIDKIKNKQDVNISIDLCVNDMNEILKHANINYINAIIGWSTGAQVALAFIALKFQQNDKFITNTHLILLNPSISQTLTYTFQPFIPWFRFIGKLFAKLIIFILKSLQLLISSFIWDILKLIAYSSFFRIILECIAFIGGNPPEQGLYFHEYIYDTFATREHTKGLLNLIIALNDNSLYKTIYNHNNQINNYTTILSGYCDFMTGIYLSREIEQTIHKKSCRHIIFTMGTHFLVLEWPDLVAKEILFELMRISKDK